MLMFRSNSQSKTINIRILSSTQSYAISTTLLIPFGRFIYLIKKSSWKIYDDFHIQYTSNSLRHKLHKYYESNSLRSFWRRWHVTQFIHAWFSKSNKKGQAIYCIIAFHEYKSVIPFDSSQFFYIEILKLKLRINELRQKMLARQSGIRKMFNVI